MENDDFGDLDLSFDEAAEARIAHVEYLNFSKDWGKKAGNLIAPFAEIARLLLAEDRTEMQMKIVENMFPLGLSLLIDHMNVYYEHMQREAAKVLGAPFQLHDAHHPDCDGTTENCGHQDHYLDEK